MQFGVHIVLNGIFTERKMDIGEFQITIGKESADV